jgi:hypothetical protein
MDLIRRAGRLPPEQKAVAALKCEPFKMFFSPCREKNDPAANLTSRIEERRPPVMASTPSP